MKLCLTDGAAWYMKGKDEEGNLGKASKDIGERKGIYIMQKFEVSCDRKVMLLKNYNANTS